MASIMNAGNKTRINRVIDQNRDAQSMTLNMIAKNAVRLGRNLRMARIVRTRRYLIHQNGT